MTECFHCGDDDHLSYDCPRHTRISTAPDPAHGLTPAPESNRPENKPVPEPVPAAWRAQYDDAAPWAEWVREKMGWPRHASEAAELRSRAKASRQVSESRAARTILP